MRSGHYRQVAGLTSVGSPRRDSIKPPRLSRRRGINSAPRKDKHTPDTLSHEACTEYPSPRSANLASRTVIQPFDTRQYSSRSANPAPYLQKHPSRTTQPSPDDINDAPRSSTRASDIVKRAICGPQSAPCNPSARSCRPFLRFYSANHSSHMTNSQFPQRHPETWWGRVPPRPKYGFVLRMSS